MKKQQVIALVGDTLLIDSVEASLGCDTDLRLVRISTQASDYLECFRAQRPDLVIFDANDLLAQMVLPFFRIHSSVPLLCLDAACDNVVLLSAQQYTAHSSRDLMQFIQGGLKPSTEAVH